MRTTPGSPWWWRHAGIPAGGSPADPAAPAPSAPFPQSPLPTAVDLFMFGNWVEVTRLNTGQAGVYARDAVTVTRGRSSEGGVTDPTLVAFTLNNRDGRFSPRNPVGPYYGQIGRNTQARVRVGTDVRGVGEVTAWPSRWTGDGQDVWVPVQAAGILRRLQQGNTPLRSAPYRAITGSATRPAAYWTLTDGTTATRGVAETPAAGPAALNQPNTAGITNYTLLPDWGNGEMGSWLPNGVSLAKGAAVSAHVGTSSSTHWAVDHILCVGTDRGASQGFWATIYVHGGPYPAIDWDIEIQPAGAVASDRAFLSKFVIQSDGSSASVLLTTVSNLVLFDGNPHHFRLDVQQSGADIAWTLYVDGVATTGTVAATTLQAPTKIELNPGYYDIQTSFALSDLAVWGPTVPGVQDFADAAAGWAGETAGARLARLCAEEGIVYVQAHPEITDTVTMGPQGLAKLVDLLRDCETADQGILYEPRDRLGLGYLPRVALYNQAPALTLDYSAADLSQLDPTDDDLLVRNDWTVNRPDGSTVRATLDTGALSTQDPPGGAGRYDSSATVNVETDAALPDQANWRVHLGTVDEPRYPQIGVNLARANFTAHPALAATAAAVDVGDVAAVTNPPAWLPVGTIQQVMQGFTERLSQFERTIVANCVPASPYDVGIYGTSSYSSDGSYLAADITATQTLFDVSTPSGPLWMTLAEWATSGSAPFNILVGGENMLVTANGTSGAASPQQFAVIRSINGVVKTHPAGEAVTLAEPGIYAL